MVEIDNDWPTILRDVAKSDRNAECHPEDHDAWGAANYIDDIHIRIAELAAENERLTKLLAGRDSYIVDQGLWGDFVARLPATNTVDAHETANVSDKPEGQQPVAWESVKDHLPEVGSKFVLLYDDGSGASLYFRHDSGYIDADGDECDALDENRMWAYLPAGFEFWCEGACEPITLPKWKGPSTPRPSEQAVTWAGKGLLRIVEEIDGAMKHGTWRDEKGMRLKDTPEWVAFYNALKVAMEVGR